MSDYLPLGMRSYFTDLRARQKAAVIAESAEFFADDPTRDIPDIEFPYPPCPICQGDLENDDGWWCVICNVGWPRSGMNGERHMDMVTEQRDL